MNQDAHIKFSTEDSPDVMAKAYNAPRIGIIEKSVFPRELGRLESKDHV
jgi:hypothetical protein